MKKLLPDDKDNLIDLAQHPGWSALGRLLDAIAWSLEDDVLKCDLASQSDRELVVRKARSEGARKVITSLSTQMNLIKEQVRSKTE